MKYSALFPVIATLLFLTNCSPNNKGNQIVSKTDSLSIIKERISFDFSVTEEQIKDQIEKRTGPCTSEDITKWEEKGWLEYQMINGKKMYFNRAVSNLILLKNFYEQKDKSSQEEAKDPQMIARLKHSEEVYKTSSLSGLPVIPAKMKITYTITVNADVVPEGEIIRCWLPYPKESHPRQKGIELLNTSKKDFIISPDSSIHRTLYIEDTAKKGIPATFQISYTYQSSAQYFNPDNLKPLPYKKESLLYKKYTSEQLPQICFTGKVRHIADSLTKPDDDSEAVVRKLYMWFKENIPWTGALEYSIMQNIPEYVIENMRGDCGMQTMLFMSMLRYKGIPVRWQSGWMVPPVAENLHDWCEVYYEGTGWIPVDVSYDLQNSNIQAIREFYLSGIDSYRLIVNDGISGPLYPEKQYMRSEPYDFQRGEVEWRGGNLYFDKWDYDMKIEYIK